MPRNAFLPNMILLTLLLAAPQYICAALLSKGGSDTGVATLSSDAVAQKIGADRNASLPGKKEQEMPYNDAPILHLRHSEMGIPVGEALDPPLCPPPSVTRSLGICYLRKCNSHQDCPRNAACCFNGCIHACVEPMDAPAAFDWIEDTSKILPILDVDFDDPPQQFFPVLVEDQSTKYAAAEGGEELVHLPGGCFVTASRYTKLKQFMDTPSIKKCRCSDGEVVCDVRTERT